MLVNSFYLLFHFSDYLIIIYDLSDNDSFKNIEEWINFIKQVNTDESLLILCGNKSDLERKVNYKEGYELAQKHGMMFFETSAKTSENLNLMMYTGIAQLPFFSQFDIDKKILTEELQKLNEKIKEKPQEPIMNVKDEEGKTQQVIIIQRKKKSGCGC